MRLNGGLLSWRPGNWGGSGRLHSFLEGLFRHVDRVVQVRSGGCLVARLAVSWYVVTAGLPTAAVALHQLLDLDVVLLYFLLQLLNLSHLLLLLV